jgi:hypothetical protein
VEQPSPLQVEEESPQDETSRDHIPCDEEPSLVQQQQEEDSLDAPASPQPTHPAKHVRFQEDLEKEEEEEKVTSTEKPLMKEDPQCGFYRSLLTKSISEFYSSGGDSGKIQDLAELIFEIKQAGLDAWIDINEAEDIVF